MTRASPSPGAAARPTSTSQAASSPWEPRGLLSGARSGRIEAATRSRRAFRAVHRKLATSAPGKPSPAGSSLAGGDAKHAGEPMDRRQALREARQREKVAVDRADLGEQLGWDQLQRVERLENDFGADVLRPGPAAVPPAEFARLRLGSELERLVATDERPCAGCNKDLQRCVCPNFSGAFAPRMLEDEYALLAFRDADQAAEDRRREAAERAAGRAVYASELQMQQQAAQEQERMRREQEAVFHAAMLRRQEQWRREALVAEQEALRRRQATRDALDDFCQEKQAAEDRERRLQQAEEKQRLDEAMRRGAEEERALERRQQAARARAAEDVQELRRQQRFKQEQAEQERLADVAMLRESEAAAARREEERAQARKAMMATTHEHAYIARLEEQRKADLERAFERWEVEKRERDDREAAARAQARAAQMAELQRVRGQQVQEQAAMRQEAAEIDKAYARELQRQAAAARLDEQARASQQVEHRAAYRHDLEMQVQQEQITRKERLRIGMNEVERKLNRPLLQRLERYGVVCDSKSGCRVQGECTCGPRAPLGSRPAATSSLGPSRAGRVLAYSAA